MPAGNVLKPRWSGGSRRTAVTRAVIALKSPWSGGSPRTAVVRAVSALKPRWNGASPPTVATPEASASKSPWNQPDPRSTSVTRRPSPVRRWRFRWTSGRRSWVLPSGRDPGGPCRDQVRWAVGRVEPRAVGSAARGGHWLSAATSSNSRSVRPDIKVTDIDVGNADVRLMGRAFSLARRSWVVRGDAQPQGVGHRSVTLCPEVTHFRGEGPSGKVRQGVFSLDEWMIFVNLAAQSALK